MRRTSTASTWPKMIELVIVRLFRANKIQTRTTTQSPVRVQYTGTRTLVPGTVPDFYVMCMVAGIEQRKPKSDTNGIQNEQYNSFKNHNWILQLATP